MEAALIQLTALMLKTLFETEGLGAVLAAACGILAVISICLWRLIRGLTRTISGLAATVDGLGQKVGSLVARADFDELAQSVGQGVEQVDGRCHDLRVRLARLEGVCEAKGNCRGPRRTQPLA